MAGAWGLLRESWGLLGCSWGPLGVSWGALGPPWKRSKTNEKPYAKEEQLPDLQKENPPRLWGAIWRPKSIQNGTQNETKFKTIFKSEKVALQEPLGAVLGRSWGILGAILGSGKAFSYWKNQYGSKIHVFNVDKLSRRVLDRTWPNLATKSAENGSKMAPQNDPKAIKK